MCPKRNWLRAMAMIVLFGTAESFVGPNASAQTTTAAIPAPTVTLSVNGPSGGTSYNGWPLVIQVDLYHPDFAADDTAVTPIPLTLNSGSWADAVRLTVTDSTGAQVNWPLHQVLRPTGADASITLDAQRSGHLAWWVAPADTAGLPAGSFQIAAVLDTSAVTDPTLFQGQSYSVPVTVAMGAEPSVLLPDQTESKYLLAAFYDTLAGSNTQAMTDVNTLLTSQPQNIRGLMAKGQLLEASGDAANALASYEMAVDAFYTVTPNPPEPPVELLERAASLRSAAISQSAALPAPHVSLQLQNFAQTSPGIYGLDLQVTNNGAGVANNFAISEITFLTETGSGQVSLDTSVPSQLPATLDSLPAGASGTLHFSLAVPAGVSTFLASETANVQNVIGSSSPVSGSETVYVVTLGPSFTSGNTTSFNVGTAGNFAVTATGAPPPALSEAGALPGGVSFTDGGNGAGTLAGTAAVGSGGLYGFTLQAANGVGSGVTQNFTLVVNEGATITSASSTTFTVGTAKTFSVKTTGYPAPTLSESGTLPSGVSFSAGALSGTAAAGTGGVYPLTFKAANGVATASQSFTLAVDEATNFTSAAAATFTQGNLGSFTIACSGFPTATISESGALPAGVTFVNNGNGTATLAGTPGAAGMFNLVFACSNSSSASATQNFVLTVTGGGGGSGASLIVSPTSVDFGKVQSGHRASKDITLTNNGSVAVRIDRIYLTFAPHTDRDAFRFTRTCGLRLNVGASCTVRVEFDADDPGRASAVLDIVDSAARSPQTVTLTGTALAENRKGLR